MNSKDIARNLKRLPGSLYIVFLAILINRIGTFVFPFITIFLTNTKGISIATTGLILSVSSIGLLLGNITSGILADKWNAKFTIILSLAINIFGYAGLTFDYSNNYFYVVFLFIGLLGMGMLGPAANYIIADLTTDEQRSFAYTVYYLCSNVGLAIGPLLGGFLISQSYLILFWGDIFTSGICILMFIIGLAAYRPHMKRIEKKEIEKPNFYKTLLANKELCIFCFIGFFLIASLFSLEYVMPLLIKNIFKVNFIYVGIVYSLNSVIVISLSFFIEQFISKKNSILMMVLAGILWTIGLVIIAFGFSLIAVIISVFFWTCGEIIYSIVMPTYISKNAAQAVKGRFLSLNDILVSVGRSIMPVTMGFLWQNQGINSVLYLITLIPLTGFLLYLRLYFLTRRKSARLQKAVEDSI